MTYSAYERTAGVSAIESIQDHSRHLTASGVFDATSTPTLTRVEQWIDETYYEIQAHLSKAGYSTTITETAVLGFLEKLNVYGAVMQIELSHPVTSRSGEENSRYASYARQYKEGLAILDTDALEEMGATRSEALSKFVEVGGRSISRKRVSQDDSDAVKPRFPRGFGRDPAIPAARSEEQGLTA